MKSRWAALLTSILACAILAAPPPLDALYPPGAMRGTTNVVTAVGKFDSWPPKVWVNGEGLTVTAETNKGKLSVVAACDAAAGARLVRLYNDDGASEPRTFIIGDQRECSEAEPNNKFSSPQEVGELPVTINGRLDKNGDVDSFGIDLHTGEWLDARVDCYTLMSKADAVLRLVTTNGQQLAWNHDFITLDPRLVWHATRDERVVLQLFGFAYPPGSDVGFTGGEAAVYRLHLAVTNHSPGICEAPDAKEANNDTNTQPVELPANIHGTIARSGKEDRFCFNLSKGEFIDARVEAASLGSSLDAWLKIEDTAGNQLARNDDADGSPDPRLEWKAPTNGTFVAAIGSATHRGGNDACYRLMIRKVSPDFRAVLAANSFQLTVGATNELKLNVKRLRGFTNELTLAFRDLPAGVTALTTNLAQKDGDISIPLTTAADAVASEGALRIFTIDAVTHAERAVPFELTTRGETGYAHLLVETSDHLWLTVKPKPKKGS